MTSEIIIAAPFAIALPLLVVLGTVILRLERERRRYEHIRSRLESDVETMSHEIHRRLLEFEQAEKERMLVEERHRIMRDVHDGLGGLLIQGIALTERDRCSPELREVLSLALNDLRLIVDSLSPTDSRLATLIASFRHLHRRMHAGHSCSFSWHVDSINDLDIGPSRSLSILRIIQEALTNIAKHSMATRAAITIMRASSEAIFVTIKDNGIGISTTQSGGRGLTGMRQRATELNADLAVRSSPAGTTVSLVVPHHTATEEKPRPNQQPAGSVTLDRLHKIGKDNRRKGYTGAVTTFARAVPHDRATDRAIDRAIDRVIPASLAEKRDRGASPRTALRCGN